ncbi:hypothetical protein EII38_00815 [Streptococcus minor]|uniref:Uncharacterized protein n=1 Tax=Streptococcus minor TaxID=229549 RepID=A0A3P1VF79_9STRE|nr:hypothetical protein [Streptococcus minor]RRD32306.1 hypothetical protein EII38_00815 [Streptococcus minor]
MLNQRVKQIIWNDTAKNLYSDESIARRLLTCSEDREFIKLLTGLNDEHLDKLEDQNRKIIRKVIDMVCLSFHYFDVCNEGEAVMSNHQPIESMSDILGLSEEQYLLLEKEWRKVFHKKTNKTL